MWTGSLAPQQGGTAAPARAGVQLAHAGPPEHLGGVARPHAAARHDRDTARRLHDERGQRVSTLRGRA